MVISARSLLLGRIRAALPEGGLLVLDAFPPDALSDRKEGTEIAERLWDGFWAAGDYVGLKASFVYPEASAALDRFLIVEPDRQREVFAWLQYLAPEQLSAELAESGFETGAPLDAVTGLPWAGGAEAYALLATAC